MTLVRVKKPLLGRSDTISHQVVYEHVIVQDPSVCVKVVRIVLECVSDLLKL